MSPIDERLKALGVVLPNVMPPVVDGYVPAFAPHVQTGHLIYLSGRLGREAATRCGGRSAMRSRSRKASLRCGNRHRVARRAATAAPRVRSAEN